MTIMYVPDALDLDVVHIDIDVVHVDVAVDVVDAAVDVVDVEDVAVDVCRWGLCLLLCSWFAL